MSFSFHPNTKDLQFHYIYTNNFIEIEKDSPRAVARAISRFCTSPIVWEQGVRKQKNYKYSDWMVLDFDDGVTIEDTLSKLGSYVHVLGTTKSHQKRKKGKGKCDRFRLWLKLAERCTSLENFSYTTRKLGDLYGSDTAAVDGARKFLPCKEIYSIKEEGKLFYILNKPAPKPVQFTQEFNGSRHKFIPAFVKSLLVNGPTGSRNFACYKIAQYLSKNNFNQDEIVAMIMGSAVPSKEATLSEVRSAVSNGCRAAL